MDKYDPSRYFTVTLNSSDTSNANNKICHFETVLPRPRMLEGEWLVGLSEIQYSRSWFNIPEDQIIGITDSKGKETECPQKVEKGFYENVELVCEAINNAIKSAKGNLISKYAKHGDITIRPPHVTPIPRSRAVNVIHGITPEHGKLYLRLSKDLEGMLGLQPLTTAYEVDNTVSTANVDIYTDIIKGQNGAYQCYDLNRGIHSIFVYCNLIVPSYVGNSFAKLLRVVPVQNKKFGDQCSQVYPKPYFYPLLCNALHKIEVELKDHTGTFIPFEFGEATIVLEFMRQ